MRGSKRLFLWLLRSSSSIVSIPQKACSVLLRSFESRNRDWEPKNRIFVYNAFVLKKEAGKNIRKSETVVSLPTCAYSKVLTAVRQTVAVLTVAF